MLLRTVLACTVVCVVPAAATTSLQAKEQKAPSVPEQKAPAVLGIGDAAPSLHIAKWVKGQPVAAFEKGKTYVVEFWATWCGPCIAGFPHLSKLQKQYADKGVAIIGVTAEDPRNTLEAVEAMVKSKGDVMAYTIAWDDGRKTNEAYMKAAKQRGIPCAFIVDGNGRIAYIGHPMAMDEVLEKVVAGKHDIQQLAADAKLAREREEKAEQISNRLNKAANDKDWEGALAACDEYLALDAKQYGGAAAAKYQILALELKDMARANAWAQQALESKCKDSSEALHSIAWAIANPNSSIVERDAALAVKLAERAAVLTEEKDGDVLDTLARAWFIKGDPVKALEIQRKAVALDKRHSGPIQEYEEAVAKRG
ncbi:MAG: redoxin domain-containing protein [Planctomycetes bacterium]|nr:redoxin domain-containing protein [Planctomycetota bacterium]